MVYIAGISFDEFQLQGETSLDLRGMEDQQFAIFVSFAEIYNEYIYDLLIEAPGKGKYSRPALRVSQDRHQNYYIKGECGHDQVFMFALIMHNFLSTVESTL